MKSIKSKSKSHYRSEISALVGTEIDPANRSQSRPRVGGLLLVLASVLTALVTVANVFAPSPSIGVGFGIDNDYSMPSDKYAAQQKIDDPYNRTILVLEHREEREEDSDYDEYVYYDEDADIETEEEIDDEADDEDDESYYENDWSDEQIEEMERYYERYLEVFYEKHGYGYEPEDIEVVYTEYLKFKEQKAEERLEREKQSHSEQVQIVQSKPQEPHSTTNDAEEDVETNKNEGESSLESYEVRPTQYPDNTIIKHDPYYLEMEWEDFNEVGGDHFASNNYTETLSAVSISTTIVVVDRSSMKDDSTVQQPLSGRGQVYAV